MRRVRQVPRVGLVQSKIFNIRWLCFHLQSTWWHTGEQPCCQSWEKWPECEDYCSLHRENRKELNKIVWIVTALHPIAHKWRNKDQKRGQESNNCLVRTSEDVFLISQIRRGGRSRRVCTQMSSLTWVCCRHLSKKQQKKSNNSVQRT